MVIVFPIMQVEGSRHVGHKELLITALTVLIYYLAQSFMKNRTDTIIRCFLGFEFSPDTLAYLRKKIEPVERLLAEEQGWDIRLVRPENWHVTLLFFPGLKEAERGSVWAEVEMAARDGVWRDLEFQWQGLAVWPSPRRPGLICLEAGLYPGSVSWPLPIDREPFSKGKRGNYLKFRPHSTVMRFPRRWRGSVGREWKGLQERLPSFASEKIKLERVSLFLSTLTSEEPVYPRERTIKL